MPFPSPTIPVESRSEVFLGYLDFFRSRIIEKALELPEADVRRSRLPSGWAPIELLKHLTFVELRWLVWGFAGQDVADPFGDWRDDRWYVDPAETLDDVVAALRAQGEQTRAVVLAHDLAAVGQPSDRWDGEPPPTLERILFHLVQEYAHHMGHLDIVAELAAGAVKE